MKTTDYVFLGVGIFAFLLFANRKKAISTVTNTLTMLSSREQLKPFFRVAENVNGLPQGILERMAQQESSFRPEVINGTVKSSAGAVGLLQIVPKWHPGVNPTDPIASINYAGKYLKELYQKTGTWEKALAAYNWGIGNVLNKGMLYAPAETRNYVTQILKDVTV